MHGTVCIGGLQHINAQMHMHQRLGSGATCKVHISELHLSVCLCGSELMVMLGKLTTGAAGPHFTLPEQHISGCTLHYSITALHAYRLPETLIHEGAYCDGAPAPV
jgi:hypothetical protein